MISDKRRREYVKHLRGQAEVWRDMMPGIRMSDRRPTDSIHMAFGLDDVDTPVHEALGMLADMVDCPRCGAETSEMITDEERHEMAEESRARGACEGFDNCDECHALSMKSFNDKWVSCHLDDRNAGHWKTIADSIDCQACDTGAADDRLLTGQCRSIEPEGEMTERTCAACADYRCGVCKIDGFITGSPEAVCERYRAKQADGGDARTGIECPDCGGQIDFHAGHIPNGRVFVCEKGKPLMREVEYRCGNCNSTIIFLEKCEPEVTG